jgi:futalosine hydrolase
VEAAVSAQPSAGATLVLVPTELELARLSDLGGFPGSGARVEICGFGPVAAAARTAELLAHLFPAQVLLVGIAGCYDEAELPVGSAASFREAAIEGIGVGEGERLLAPPALGFPQWPAREGRDAIEDRVPLAPAHSGVLARLLLSTCAASDSPAQAASRRRRFPAAAAEDMEGFAVAFACALARVPCTVVRGISNVAGDREAANWRIPAALAAARTLALAHLGKGPQA